MRRHGLLRIRFSAQGDDAPAETNGGQSSDPAIEPKPRVPMLDSRYQGGWYLGAT